MTHKTAAARLRRERDTGSITDPTSPRAGPASPNRPWLNRWMAALRTFGNIQAWLILSLFYIVLIAPVGFVFRLAADPLRLRTRGATWQPLARAYDRMDQALEQS